jgi:hypothetical protein
VAGQQAAQRGQGARCGLQQHVCAPCASVLLAE